MASELRVDTLKDAAGNNSVGMAYVAGGSAKAWADIDQIGTAALDNSSNGSSITDNGTGDVTFTFTSSLSNVNYACSGMTSAQSSFNDEGSIHLIANGRATGSCRFGTTDVHNAADALDYDPVMVIIHGDLA